MNPNSPRIAVVGVAGGWSSEALADAVHAETGYRLLVQLQDCVANITRREVWFGDTNLCSLDGIIVKKLGTTYSPDLLDRLEVLRLVEATGVRVFSRPGSIMRLLDRLSCTVTLAANGIPMPDTTVTESVQHAVSAVQRYESAVLKPLFSTKARGMVILDCNEQVDIEQQVTAFRDAGNPVMYIQKKLDIPERDLGVVFLAGEYLGTYARVKSGNSWNTTIRAGGRYEKHEPDTELIELARRAQEPFGLDMTGVDVVETRNGPVVFEVSAFGGFRGMRDALGINSAALYARHAVKALTR